MKFIPFAFIFSHLINLATLANLALLASKELTENEILKLHAQFGHRSASQLKKLIKNPEI